MVKNFIKPFPFLMCSKIKKEVMESKKDNKSEDTKKAGTSKEKASFDQNGQGASEKYGQAGDTPNESGKEGPGTVNKSKSGK